MSSLASAKPIGLAERRVRFRWSSLLAHGVLTVGAVTMVIPFLWMLHTSTMPTAEAYKYPPILLPSRRAWENYGIAFSLLPFGRFYLNSLLVSTRPMITGGRVGVGVGAGVGEISDGAARWSFSSEIQR